MKSRKRYDLWLVLIFLASTPVFAVVNLNQWQGSAKIQLSGTQKYKAFFLPEAVYQYSLPEIWDVRLVDERGEFVPYFIEQGFQVTQKTEETCPAALLKSFRKKNDSYFDFRIHPKQKYLDPIGNTLIIALPGHDFYKEIEIYGGYDGISWNCLGLGSFYQVAGIRQDRFVMPELSTYSYYRLKVINNVENLAFQGLSLVNAGVKEAWQEFERKTSLDCHLRNEAKTSILTIENPGKLHIKRLIIHAEGNFQRNYDLYTGNHPRKLLSSGTLYSLMFESKKLKDTEIAFEDTSVIQERIRLEIDNQDSRPLKISQIEAVYTVHRLIFEDVGSKEYRLLFGNPHADRPRYDLEYFHRQLLKEKLDVVTLSEMKVTKQGFFMNEKDVSKYLNIVVVIITVMLGGLLVGKLKKVD